MPTIYDFAIEGTITDLKNALKPGRTKSDYDVLIKHTIKILKGMQVRRAWDQGKMEGLQELVNQQAEIKELWLGNTNATGDLLRIHLRKIHQAIEKKLPWADEAKDEKQTTRH